MEKLSLNISLKMKNTIEISLNWFLKDSLVEIERFLEIRAFLYIKQIKKGQPYDIPPPHINYIINIQKKQ